MSLTAQALTKQKQFLGTVEARDEYGTWPVKIELLEDQFIISGRYTRLDTYLIETDRGYLVAVTNYNRCGHVPEDCTAYDIMDYVGIENKVDATTLAAKEANYMAKILPFPGPGIRAEIHTMVTLYASGKWSRQKMMTGIASRLDEYGIKRLAVGDYFVRKADPVPTVLRIWPVVIIEAKRVTTEPCCPACRSEAAGYLAGDDMVTVMCRNCGCIYQFKEVHYFENPQSFPEKL